MGASSAAPTTAVVRVASRDRTGTVLPRISGSFHRRAVGLSRTALQETGQQHPGRGCLDAHVGSRRGTTRSGCSSVLVAEVVVVHLEVLDEGVCRGGAPHGGRDVERQLGRLGAAAVDHEDGEVAGVGVVGRA